MFIQFIWENMDKRLKILLIFSALVFGAGIAYSFYFKITPAIDARAYNDIAWNIAQGNGYRESADVPFEKDNSIVRVGPGYEFFLAVRPASKPDLALFMFSGIIWRRSGLSRRCFSLCRHF